MLIPIVKKLFYATARAEKYITYFDNNNLIILHQFLGLLCKFKSSIKGTGIPNLVTLNLHANIIFVGKSTNKLAFNQRQKGDRFILPGASTQYHSRGHSLRDFTYLS